MKTPTTPEGLVKFDNLPPKDAIFKAWLEPGINPEYHERMKDEVRKNMPLLARAIERLAESKYECSEIIHGRGQVCGPDCKLPKLTLNIMKITNLSSEAAALLIYETQMTSL